MIPINHITRWEKVAPWIYQSQIEQDLVLSRAEYEKNRIDKMTSKDFLNDAKQVLPEHASWDPKLAFQVVSDKRVKHLAGEPWKG